MSFTEDAQAKYGELTDQYRSLSDASIVPSFRGQDFPEGFLIEELEGPKKTVRLLGSNMPLIPFKFGGKQRIKKDEYAGHSEPVMQVLGSSESDMKIQGNLKDNRYKSSSLYGASQEIQELIDSVRIRGNICRFVLGDWQRYGLIEETAFEMIKKSNIKYEISFSLIGFNAPSNAMFLSKKREIPFSIKNSLIEEANNIQLLYKSLPSSVPRSIADLINSATSSIAGVLKTITDFVDGIVNTVEDIQNSIERLKGLVKHAKNKIREYKSIMSNFKAKNLLDGTSLNETGITKGAALSSIYSQAHFASSGLSSASKITTYLNNFERAFKDILPQIPQARHYVKNGDTLQSISIKFFNTADKWSEIYDFNNLSTSTLEIGSAVEIPRTI